MYNGEIDPWKDFPQSKPCRIGVPRHHPSERWEVLGLRGGVNLISHNFDTVQCGLEVFARKNEPREVLLFELDDEMLP